MSGFPLVISSRMNERRLNGLERSVLLPSGIDFCSNDYLGFANDCELLRRVNAATAALPIGSTGSRLLRGHSDVHKKAEQTLARFCEVEEALLYPSGYQANVGLLSGLLTSADRVYSDEFNHASIIDGIRLSGCQKKIYPHVNFESLETLLKEDKGCSGLKVIVTESIFSMGGDFAPLKELLSLARRYNAELVVDEAHATGIFHSGIVASLGLSKNILATVHTGGKALGVSGAWIAGSHQLKEYLLNFSRSQIFSTAISPRLACSLESAVLFHSDVGGLRSRELFEKISRFRERMGFDGRGTFSPIIPYVIGTPEDALNGAKEMRKKGFDLRAIRPPTVARDQCLLRITLNWNHTESELCSLADALLETEVTR